MDSYEGVTDSPDTFHKYLYADGNPIDRIDPLGFFSIPEILTVAFLMPTIVSVPKTTYISPNLEVDIPFVRLEGLPTGAKLLAGARVKDRMAKGKKYNAYTWVQCLTSKRSTGGKRVNDPPPGNGQPGTNDGYPWYWHADFLPGIQEDNADSINAITNSKDSSFRYRVDIAFDDKPQQKDIFTPDDWRAETYLVGLTANGFFHDQFEAILKFSWGYSTQWNTHGLELVNRAVGPSSVESASPKEAHCPFLNPDPRYTGELR